MARDRDNAQPAREPMGAASDKPAEPSAPAQASAPAKTPMFVVVLGEVHYHGRVYAMGESIPVSEAQAMLMPWAIERR